MDIILNDKTAATSAANVEELAEELGLPENGVAIAIGKKLVKRSEWADTALSENASVTVIKAVCGG